MQGQVQEQVQVQVQVQVHLGEEEGAEELPGLLAHRQVPQAPRHRVQQLEERGDRRGEM